VTVDGTLTSQFEQPTDAPRGAAAVLVSLQEIIGRVAGSVKDLTSIGVACAGQVHPETGAIVFAPNLGWRHVPLAETLFAAFGVPVTVENDVRAAAWGEYRFGAHRSAHSLLAIFVGTGVGSGAVLQGRLWVGAGNGAGEIGHTQVVADGLPCPCGGRGCLEAYASGSGLRRRAEAAVASGAKTALAEICAGEPDGITATLIAAVANSGDELARGLWSDARRYLTLGVANYVTLVNPAVLVLGGGVIEALPELFDDVAGGVLTATTMLARESVRIERARLGQWAGVLGAAALAAQPRHPQ
jgi:glucokinase